jgi:hypothetical protein
MSRHTEKSVTYNLNGSLVTSGQFHQHFVRSFFIRKFRVQLFCTYILVQHFFCRKDIGAKAALKMLVKLTHTNNFSYANATALMNNFE